MDHSRLRSDQIMGLVRDEPIPHRRTVRSTSYGHFQLGGATDLLHSPRGREYKENAVVGKASAILLAGWADFAVWMDRAFLLVKNKSKLGLDRVVQLCQYGSATEGENDHRIQQIIKSL
jgi:hypothetical protein